MKQTTIEIATPSAKDVETIVNGETKVSAIQRVRRRVAVILAAMTVLVLGGTGAAMAATPSDPFNGDPLAGGGDGIFGSLQAYLQTHLTTLVFGLATVAIAVGLVLRWVKKAVHA